MSHFKIPAPKAATRTRILAYLGCLHKDEWVVARKLCLDLLLPFTTAKNTLAGLEDRMLVEKKISNIRGVYAEFRIHPHAAIRATHPVTGKTELVAFVPPEWDDQYGKRPNAN